MCDFLCLFTWEKPDAQATSFVKPWNLHLITMSFVSEWKQTQREQIPLCSQAHTQCSHHCDLKSGSLHAQCYPPSCYFSWHTSILKIHTNKCKQRQTIQRKDLTCSTHYTRKRSKEKTDTDTAKNAAVEEYISGWFSSTFERVRILLHTNPATVFLICCLPPCRLTVPRQYASALLQGLQSRDTRQTDRPCIEAEPIGLASVSCLAFKTPPLTPLSWEKWRTWQARSLGSHWASFQSPWVSAGVRHQRGAPG